MNSSTAMPVLLDGAITKAETISPKLHRYVGMYREPFHPGAVPVYEGVAPFGYCPSCRTSINSSSGPHHWACWAAGHFDLAQYETVKVDSGVTIGAWPMSPLPDSSPFYFVTHPLQFVRQDKVVSDEEAEGVCRALEKAARIHVSPIGNHQDRLEWRAANIIIALLNQRERTGRRT